MLAVCFADPLGVGKTGCGQVNNRRIGDEVCCGLWMPIFSHSGLRKALNLSGPSEPFARVCLSVSGVSFVT